MQSFNVFIAKIMQSFNVLIGQIVQSFNVFRMLSRTLRALT